MRCATPLAPSQGQAQANAAFVANWKMLLEVYHQPGDPERPLVCLDGTWKQLITETRVPIPAEPGRL